MDSIQRNWKKLIVILITFSVFILLNEMIFYFLAPEVEGIAMGESIAIVTSSQASHLRKNANNELWTELKVGDSLYLGDSIRTSVEGSLKITFLAKNQIVEIEPDSLLVLQESAGKLTLDVLEGKLLVQNAEQKSSFDFIIKQDDGFLTEEKNDSTKKITLSLPQEDQELFYTPQQKELVEFKWSEVPGSKYEFWLGPSRKAIQKIKTISANQLSLPLIPGNYFWKVNPITMGKNKIESEVSKFKITQRNPPMPMAPNAGAYIKTKNLSEKVQFTWRVSFPYEKVEIEIFDDISKHKIVQKESLKNTNQFLSDNLFPGTYYWQLKGFPDEQSEPVTSALLTFTIEQRQKLNLPLAWSDQTETNQFFIGDSPVINLNWSSIQHPAFKAFKIKLTKLGDLASSSTIEIAKDNKFYKRLNESGRYIASIEALDDEGEKIATLPARSFEIRPMPLLNAIQFLNVKETSLKSDNFGNIKIEWQIIDQALAYRFTLHKANGDTIQQENVKENSIEFKDLLPGFYKFVVQGIDQFGRPGDKSKTLTLFVPNENILNAPKIKKMEVD